MNLSPQQIFSRDAKGASGMLTTARFIPARTLTRLSWKTQSYSLTSRCTR